ncbi:cohesin domain-containing protein [Patescibacteria group bacterium]|nr:cohesin domain-containing protein [Patescibacteria group bacterium]
MKTWIKVFLLIIPIAIGAWFLVHIMAIFGLFLAVALPIWWFILPRQTFCFFCRLKKDGEICPSCKVPVSKAEGIYIKTIHSAFYNAGLVICFFVLSAGLVFLESKILVLAGFPAAEKSVSFIIPPRKEYKMGEIFPMDVKLVGIKRPINAVRIDIAFDPRRVEVSSISTDNSFANIFIQKEIDNKTGYARLTGGLPNPGFLGTEGNFVTFYLKGKMAGMATVNFLPTSMVLANDGNGTNVIKDLGEASFLISPQKISQRDDKFVSIKTDVLSASTPESKLIFYDDEKREVLGVETQSKPENFELFGWAKAVFQVVVDIDHLILGFWESLVRFLTFRG